MYISPEHIAATNKASVETLVGLANTQFAAATTVLKDAKKKAA